MSDEHNNYVVEIFVSFALRAKDGYKENLKSLGIKEDRLNNCHYVNKSFYESNLHLYKDYIYLAIQDGSITDMSPLYKLGIWLEWSSKYATQTILKHQYEENKEVCDSVGVSILVPIKRLYIYKSPYKSREYQLAHVLRAMAE
jgi:hypothetical protein